MLALTAAVALRPVAASLAGRAQAATLFSLLAAGPDGASISRWAYACALALGPGFPGGPSLQTRLTGGLDGVTGANRFDAQIANDGSTAAMFPGAALLAWLTGDSRVHFDPTHWVPVMAATNSGVLVVRSGANGFGSGAPTPQNLAIGGALKLAVDQPESHDLAILLALERIGVPTAPIFGLRSTDAKAKAYLAGEADAVFLCGEGVPEDIAPLAANAGVPVFTLGRMGDDGKLTRDPLFPALPEAMAFGAVGATAAYAAAAAAARLDFLVTLPHLTDPNAVALWQQAAQSAIATPALSSAADASSVDLRGSAGTAAELNAMALSPADQGSLQAFLQTRFGWRAS